MDIDRKHFNNGKNKTGYCKVDVWGIRQIQDMKIMVSIVCDTPTALG